VSLRTTKHDVLLALKKEHKLNVFEKMLHLREMKGNAFTETLHKLTMSSVTTSFKFAVRLHYIFE